MSITYQSTTPYFKGIHLTLGQWRGGIYKDGWKILGSELKVVDKNPETQEYKGSNISPPMVLSRVSRLSSDIHALTILTKSQTPPLRPVCPKDIAMSFYGFVNASVSGYGRSLQLPQNKGYNLECLMQIRACLRGINMSKSSSNHREFRKLV